MYAAAPRGRDAQAPTSGAVASMDMTGGENVLGLVGGAKCPPDAALPLRAPPQLELSASCVRAGFRLRRGRGEEANSPPRRAEARGWGALRFAGFAGKTF